MEELLTLRIPSEIRQMLNRTPEEISRDLRVDTALMLFRIGKLSSGAAASLAGIPRVLFLDLCAEYDIPVSQITPEELSREVGSIAFDCYPCGISKCRACGE
jgi:predicted HTH domain antitoxin